jgi:DNA-binding response OmpR family regulator
MRLLLVEDDEMFGAALQKSLLRDGYAVDWIRCGRELLPAMRSAEYECVLLDLNLPDTTGEASLKLIRGRTPGLSVIVVTARGGVMDRITLLDLGADDYLVKPVDLEEVSARVRSVTRRAQSVPGGAAVLTHGPLKLHPARRSATWAGNVVALTNKEFWVLETLVRRKNQVLTRAQLEDALYGWGEEVDSNAIEVYVHFLRRKFHASLIRTVRGAGYQLGSLESFDA